MPRDLDRWANAPANSELRISVSNGAGFVINADVQETNAHGSVTSRRLLQADLVPNAAPILIAGRRTIVAFGISYLMPTAGTPQIIAKVIDPAGNAVPCDHGHQQFNETFPGTSPERRAVVLVVEAQQLPSAGAAAPGMPGGGAV
jgi:hypothetical protein